MTYRLWGKWTKYSPPLTQDSFVPRKEKLKRIKLTEKEKKVRSRHYSIKARALKKSLSFDLSEKDVHDLIYAPCDYCGSWILHSEIDKKDPLKGYTKANCVPACHRCNTLKSNFITYEEMHKIVEVLGWRINACKS